MVDQRTRLAQLNTSLAEKNVQRSNLQNSLSKIHLDVMELKAIEYPSENEAEILVNIHKFLHNMCVSKHLLKPTAHRTCRAASQPRGDQ